MTASDEPERERELVPVPVKRNEQQAEAQPEKLRDPKELPPGWWKSTSKQNNVHRRWRVR
jgi:hypothetical protein